MPSRLVVAERGLVLAQRVHAAVRPRDRMRGLLGGSELVCGEGLLLSPCKQVHTFGMKYAIDVVFCDRDWSVVRVIGGMRPGRISRIEWRARHILELPRGAAAQVMVGDRLLAETL